MATFFGKGIESNFFKSSKWLFESLFFRRLKRYSPTPKLLLSLRWLFSFSSSMSFFAFSTLSIFNRVASNSWAGFFLSFCVFLYVVKIISCLKNLFRKIVASFCLWSLMELVGFL
jgi:hypothetical protein